MKGGPGQSPWKFRRKQAQAILRDAWRRTRDVRIVRLRRNHGVGIYQAARRYWGSWGRALIAAGVPGEVALSRFDWILAARHRP